MLKLFLKIFSATAFAQYIYTGSSPSRGSLLRGSTGVGNFGAGNELPNPLGVTNLSGVIPKLLNGITLLAAPIVVAMVLWGAFQIIISAGSPEKLRKGGMTVLWAAVGFGLLLLANGAVAIIQSLFQK